MKWSFPINQAHVIIITDAEYFFIQCLPSLFITKRRCGHTLRHWAHLNRFALMVGCLMKSKGTWCTIRKAYAHPAKRKKQCIWPLYHEHHPRGATGCCQTLSQQPLQGYITINQEQEWKTHRYFWRREHFELHWPSGFRRVYSNCCCSCSFEPKIIKIRQSSQKLYSNNIANFQKSTTVLNAHTKKVWKLIVYTLY